MFIDLSYGGVSQGFWHAEKISINQIKENFRSIFCKSMNNTVDVFIEALDSKFERVNKP